MRAKPQFSSRPMRVDQSGLRSLLDWSPETRGRGGDGAGEITVFSELNNILRQSWVSVFSTISCQTFHLPLQVQSGSLIGPDQGRYCPLIGCQLKMHIKILL